MSFSFPRFKAIDGNGNPIRGGLLSTYEEGTSTDKSAFTDIGLTVAHTNPIVLNSEGEALIFLNGRYKMNLTRADGAQVPGWPIDNIGDPAQGAAAAFYPNADAADQGVTGDSNTVKYAVDTIGATNKGTIYLRHDGGGEFTDYIFSTSETIPSNITLEREPGARLSIDSGKVVTLNGPIEWPGLIHTLTGAGSVVIAADYETEVFPEWWGIDGTADEVAINKALVATADAGAGGFRPSGFTAGTGRIVKLTGAYSTAAPIVCDTNNRLIGSGYGTTITEGGGFSGTELIQFLGSFVRPGGFLAGSIEVGNLQLIATTVGVAAIRNGNSRSMLLVDGWIHDILVMCEEGIQLASDTATAAAQEYWGAQFTIIERIYYGEDSPALSYAIQLSGNHNVIQHINDEANSGSRVGGAIEISSFDDRTNSSLANTIKHCLIEQIGHANQYAIDLNAARQTVVENIWWEKTGGSAYWIKLTDCKNTAIMGRSRTPAKIGIATSLDTYIEHLDIASTNQDNIENFLEVDGTSDAAVGILYSMRGSGVFPHNPLIVVNKHVHIQTAAAGYVFNASQKKISGQNLLVNPSFEAGIYGWTLGGASSATFQDSELGLGNMIKHATGADASRSLFQTVVVPAAWVGQSLTLSFWAKVVNSDSTDGAFANPYLSGAGITFSTGYMRVKNDDGWMLCTQTFTIQSQSNIEVGALSTAVDNANDEFYYDDFCLGFGNEVTLGAGKFASIELGYMAGSKTITTLSAAPATGTWKVGDIVFDSVPVSGQQMGWMCTVAGTPGTWVAMANLA